MSTIARPARLRADVDALADVVEGLAFGLDTDDGPHRRARREHLLGVLRRHLDHRLADPGAPLTVVLFGPTGSGKSTLTNTLAGRAISRSGALRPTTTEAVAWCSADHADGVADALGRTGPIDLAVDDHPLLHSLVVVDTPDIDSIAVAHRRQTEAILQVADVAIAVTTPQRYADAVPWDVLAALTERDLELVVVMNRASRRASGAVADLASHLRSAKVGGVESADDIVVIQEQRVRRDGRLPGQAVKRLEERLGELASDAPTVAERSLRGSVRHAVATARELAVEVEDQAGESAALEAVIDDALDGQRHELAQRLEAGDLVRAEVVERWRRIIGVSDLATAVGRGAARIRDLVLAGRGPVDVEAVATVDHEVRDELVRLAVGRVERASTAVEIGWSVSPAADSLLGSVVEAPDTAARAADAVTAWQAGVVESVAAAGVGRFRLARAATIGINTAATLLLLGVFAATGGITGTEVGVAAGAAAAQQTVLERVFGAAAAGRLARRAREDLVERLGAVVDGGLAPYRAALGGVTDDTDAADRLREAAATIELHAEELLDG